MKSVNRLCAVEDFRNPEYTFYMRTLMPDLVATHPEYPLGLEHRKVWEYAHILGTLNSWNMLDGATVCSVGSGHEEPAYYISNRARWIFLTDIYGSGDFQEAVAPSSMLVNPDQFARCPHNRKRMVVQHMSGTDLRFEDGTFDVLYSFSSIEHFGGYDDAVKALNEASRVLRPGGVAAITTECIVNDAEHFECPGLMLFHPDRLRAFCHSAPGLELVDELDFTIPDSTRQLAVPLEELMKRQSFPELVIEYAGRQFTSMSMFFRKH
jgi:SAM-dependent methyltransferase